MSIQLVGAGDDQVFVGAGDDQVFVDEQLAQHICLNHPGGLPAGSVVQKPNDFPDAQLEI